MNLREYLARELSKARPPRYTMNERGWVDEVALGGLCLFDATRGRWK